MFSKRSVLLQLTVILCIISVQNVTSKRFGGGSRHSYPKSGGLSGHGGSSGSGGHGYPSSGGLSGHGNTGSSHGYPSSGGLSGHGNTGGSHGYPSSGGMSGHGNTGSSHGYPSSGGQSYPKTTHTTTIHNHYHYSPPPQIRYNPPHGPPMVYPVYHGTPPTYVYQAQNSGSKYGTLLAGLALLNLGALAGTAYAHSHSTYKPKPGEICKFGMKRDNGDYEETKIDCQLITHFIFEAETKNAASNTTTVTTTVTNTTVVNTTNGVEPPAVATTTIAPGPVIYAMLPNGTLVPLNTTNNATDNANVNATANANATANVNTISTVTTTVSNTTVVNALDVKGKPVDVTPGMQCYIIRITQTSNMRKAIPCGVLQNYAVQSLKKNSSGKNMLSIGMLAVVMVGMIM